MKKYYKLIVFSGIILLIVLNFKSILNSILNFIPAISSISIGAMIAFVLNVPMKKIENILSKFKIKKGKRSIAIIITLIVVLLILGICIIVIIPNLTKTFTGLNIAFDKTYIKVKLFIENSNFKNDELFALVLKQLKNSFSMDKFSKILTSFILNTSNIFSNIFSLIIAIFFAINFLVSKEHLSNIVNKLLLAFLPQKISEKIKYIGRISVETYDKFLTSKLIEAVIVGVLIFVAYTITGLPYGAMVGVLAGVLSFIPYVGSMTALFLGFLFIFVDNPIKAFISIVVFQSVQFFEDNVIYPKVVGDSVGLPSVFTLAAAIIGGALFGIVGMIFFTPVFAIIYRLIKEYTEYRLGKYKNESK